MKFTPIKLNWFKEANEHIIAVAEKYMELKKIDYGTTYVYDVLPNGDVEVCTEVTDGCRGYYETSTSYIIIPGELFVLTDDEWYTEAKRQIDIEKEKERKELEEKRKREEEYQKAAQEKYDREQYLKLKQKYEGVL